MKISRVLHAGYVFETKEGRILFDPLFENPFSRNCYAYPNVQFDYGQIRQLHFDAIFISHFHDDHFSFESLQYLNREISIYFYCIHEELFSLLREFGFKNVFRMQTDESVSVAGFKITPCLALDADVDSIFHIKAEGLNILNVVDAWIDPSAMTKLSSYKWDMVLWPFQTMREIEVIAPSLAAPAELPVEWLEQLRILNPRYIVPSSCQFIHEEWSWYRKAYFPISYRRFEKEVADFILNTKVQRLNPGVSVELNSSGLKMAPALSWIFPVGEQDVDYEYDPSAVPQATSEIARHFAALSEAQTKRVMHFCEMELVEKYNAMGTEVTAEWKLALFDHRGEAVYFFYDLKNGKMELCSSIGDSTWVTEIPMAKVYSALEEGESLTSLYLRMQGSPFDEIGEDPLIATLFRRDVGSYQKAQIRRLSCNPA